MPATIRGIYHNLKESKYMLSNGEIMYFFSSKVYMYKFLEGYKDYRKHFTSRFHKSGNILNMDSLADIAFYKKIEKRGFCVWLKGVRISEIDVHKYAVRKMMDHHSPEWVENERPKVGVRIADY